MADTPTPSAGAMALAERLAHTKLLVAPVDELARQLDAFAAEARTTAIYDCKKALADHFAEIDHDITDAVKTLDAIDRALPPPTGESGI